MKEPKELLAAVRNMRIKTTRCQESTVVYAELRLRGKNYTKEIMLTEYEEFDQAEIELLAQGRALEWLLWDFMNDVLTDDS